MYFYAIMDIQDTAEWLDAIRSGDRRLLSRTITLAESRRPEDREKIRELLSSDMLAQGSFRIAVSGVPGVGKSTFIEALGLKLAEKHKVAVITVDPSSPQSGGSILGDKTRMEKLSAHPNVFVRPSPSGRQTGGIAPATADVMQLFELAGYRYIILETVGVGQSEVLARYLTDHFILLLLASGGDDLQGIKRGIMELADIFVFNKADITPDIVMKKAENDLKAALHLLRTGSNMPEIRKVSAVEGEGIKRIAENLEESLQSTEFVADLTEKRKVQMLERFSYLLEQGLVNLLEEKTEWKERVTALKKQVGEGKVLPSQAVEIFVERIRKGVSEK